MQVASYHQVDLAGKPMPGVCLPWPLHAACAVWPEMPPSDLRALADDVADNGLHDPITLTPDGLLLDGRNRALACVMAGVVPDTVVHEGDPVLFSLSKNKHRRHMTADQVAMAAAGLVTTTQGMNRFVDSSFELSIAKAAEAAGVSETSIKSAKAVIKYGTPAEAEAVERGRKPLRKTADEVRHRRRAAASPKPKSNSVKAPPNVDPIDALACEIITKCADGKWRSLVKIASAVRAAHNSTRDALKRLDSLEGCVTPRVKDNGIEYQIEGDDEARLRRELAAKDSEIAVLKARITEQDVEIERLTALLTAPSLTSLRQDAA